jgi:hypothetical protein
MKDKNETCQPRITLLEEYRSAIKRWFHGQYEPEGEDSLRSVINRHNRAVRNIVYEAGCLKLITAAPPPAIGGIVIQNADPFDIVFESLWGSSVIPNIVDMIDQAIGVYQHVQADTGFVSLAGRDIIDIESAIERALRPHFRSSPPRCESEVQDAIEDILCTLGVMYTREKERAPVGPRAFTPDFVLHDFDLALEAKFANEKHSASDIQEEITSDISAYRTKWKYILFVVYDLGVISDPYQMRRENMKLYGVSVVIVKH